MCAPTAQPPADVPISKGGGVERVQHVGSAVGLTFYPDQTAVILIKTVGFVTAQRNDPEGGVFLWYTTRHDSFLVLFCWLIAKPDAVI